MRGGLLVLLVASRAYAEPMIATDGVAEPEPASDRAMFGYRLGLGVLPMDGARTMTASIGLSAEHQVARTWKLFGEYEWVWTFRSKTESMPAERGDGQRAHVGVRHRFASHAWHELDMFCDGEIGAGFMLTNDNMTGLHATPDAIAGVRLGYDVHTSHGHRSPSRVLSPELVIRAIGVEDGIGMMFGVGTLWQ